MDVLVVGTLQNKVKHVVEAQELHNEVCHKIHQNREKQRQPMSRRHLPAIAVRYYMLEARVQRSGSTPVLVSTSTGPWSIVNADKVHVYGVQNPISVEVKDVHVVRIRFQADDTLE